MARVFTDGAEMGDTLPWTIQPLVTSSQKRSGTFSYYMNEKSSCYRIVPSVSEAYFRIAFRADTNWGGWSWHNYIALNNDSSGVFSLVFGNGLSEGPADPVAGRLFISSGATVVHGTAVLSLATWYLIEIHIKINDSVGVIEVKVDGVSDITYSGDTKPGTDTTFNRIYVGASTFCYFDDLALNDTTGGTDNSWCGDGHVTRLAPNGTGDVTQLLNSTGGSSNNYTYVDEVPADGDTSYCQASTSGYRDLYTVEDFSNVPSQTIRRVWVEARARDTVAAGGECNLIIKTNSTEYAGPNTQLLTTYTQQLLGTDYTLNPNTSSAWSDADLDAIQVGFKVT